MLTAQARDAASVPLDPGRATPRLIFRPLAGRANSLLFALPAPPWAVKRQVSGDPCSDRITATDLFQNGVVITLIQREPPDAVSRGPCPALAIPPFPPSSLPYRERPAASSPIWIMRAHFEPPRDSRRLHFLRGWSNEQKNEILPGDPGTGGSYGFRAPGGIGLPVGGDRLDCEQDWLHTGDPAQGGATGRA